MNKWKHQHSIAHRPLHRVRSMRDCEIKWRTSITLSSYRKSTEKSVAHSCKRLTMVQIWCTLCTYSELKCIYRYTESFSAAWLWHGFSCWKAMRRKKHIHIPPLFWYYFSKHASKSIARLFLCFGGMWLNRAICGFPMALFGFELQMRNFIFDVLSKQNQNQNQNTYRLHSKPHVYGKISHDFNHICVLIYLTLIVIFFFSQNWNKLLVNLWFFLKNCFIYNCF